MPLRSAKQFPSHAGQGTLSSRLRWLWLTLGIVVLDRATKAWFESQTTEGWRRELIHHVVYLVHSRNPGIAFGVLSESASPWTPVALISGTLLVMAVLVWLLVASGSLDASTATGFALILGGAAGNVTDRILHGAVTDFFEVRLSFLPWPVFNPWPAFNVADSAIAVGAVLVILALLFGAKHAAPEASRQHPG